jgi:hypothetical protein
MKTSSYSLSVTLEEGKSVNQDRVEENEECLLSIYPQEQGKLQLEGKTLTVVIKIMLQMGHVTGVSNSNRLFKSRELSDVTLKCGDLLIPAHKHILGTHSETFHTVFSSNSFVEGQKGVYEIKSEHMRPDILEDVVRCGVARST